MAANRLVGTFRIARARLRGRRAFAAAQAHVASHFPRAEVVSSVTPDVGIEILKAADVAGDGLVTFLTHGLSRYALPVGGTDEVVAQEMSITVDDSCSLPVERALESVARMTLYTGSAMSAGTTYQYSFAEEFEDPSLTIEGFFASEQIWLDPGELEIGADRGMRIRILELAPITASELDVVKKNPSEFIAMTVDGRIDLLDFKRSRA